MKLRSHNLLTWVPHLFLFYREKVFRKLLPIIVILTIYAILIAHFFQHATRYNLGQFHLIFSFILAIIISFRVNTSYSRWWEGRILWGAIVNNCRNLGLKFEIFAGLDANPNFYELLKKLPIIIKANLRKDTREIESELRSLGIEEYSTQHPVLLVVQRMYFILNQLRNEEKLRFEQYLALDNHLANIIDMVGGCERIANTHVPPAFAFFVKQALLFYALMFPFGWVDTFGFLIIPMMIMIVYILLGLEILSEELEEPFGKDDNDLPLSIIAKNVSRNIEQIALTGREFFK
ncbi:bestrophin family ion channel [Legionella maceachernii]|uniref:Bestrophin, RFP-TM, chloride channel n=1 Tax=Legionella maceachernii TaxID=466 RepID=A0A0W0WE42_9GAMM|nr:bestrophin family ion channel [Legionella maceachernii]KTD30637.1 Bestrophin, RFP-TM, chloride channel [Legionella maceachernii]SJZ81625.1 putative membrane protein [Legionella maceachernii]SUP02772.1 Predicted membrane protein [Legionella maceachernii]